MKIITDEIKTRSPYKDLFAIKSLTLSAITKSMKKDGFNEAEPLVYWQVDGLGHVLVDGHTRLEAAKQAGLHEVHAVRMDFDNELKAVEYAISRQKNRRNLTDDELLNCLATLDNLRQEKGGDRKSAEIKASSEASIGKSADATAKALGTSRSKIEKARTVQDHATAEVKEAIQSGDMTINKAYNVTQEQRKEEKEEKEELSKVVEETEDEYIERRCKEYAHQIGTQLKNTGFSKEQIAYVLSMVEY